MTRKAHLSQKADLRKALMGLVAVVCLLLSSCMIKSQLKILLGQDSALTTTAKTATASSKRILTPHTNLCVVHTPAALWHAATDQLQTNLRTPFARLSIYFTSAFFILLAGLLPGAHDARDRFYIGRNLPLAALPIFLRHRRLLI